MVGERSGTAVAGIESARRAVFRHPWFLSLKYKYGNTLDISAGRT